MNKQELKQIKKNILKALTEDSKDNVAIFDKKEGFANFTSTDLDIVMDKVVQGLYKSLDD